MGTTATSSCLLFQEMLPRQSICYSDSNWVRYYEVHEVSFQSKYMLGMEERTLLGKDACRSRKKGLGSRQDTILEFIISHTGYRFRNCIYIVYRTEISPEGLKAASWSHVPHPLGLPQEQRQCPFSIPPGGCWAPTSGKGAAGPGGTEAAAGPGRWVAPSTPTWVTACCPPAKAAVDTTLTAPAVSPWPSS